MRLIDATQLILSATNDKFVTMELKLRTFEDATFQLR